MCTGLSRKSYCYLIAGWTYLVGVLEIAYGAFMLNSFEIRHDLLWALIVAWIPILIAVAFLILGTCLPDTYKNSKVVLLKIWICVSLVFGLAIVIIKIGIILLPWDIIGIWRNIARIAVFCSFVLLVFCSVYFPCLYVQDLDEEFDF